ncbi:MAG TPA: Crp/Fnr family transcriptional regulator [Candidatus Deferrimicrobiaceae bacterium]|nr:Crp/Fnr family transcriptional regulator [Candidatus Deferrimicrobiaceae bacterium]
MAQLSRVASKKFEVPADNGNGVGVGNIILRNLPRSESARVFSSLEFVRLRLHQVLHETGEVIKSGYFLNDGMSSVLTVQPDGESVEVGLIGKEGFVGLPVIFGFKTSALRIITQGDGTAYRIDVGILRRLLPECPALEHQLQRYSMILGIQSTQLAACNRLHDVEERLARWLLMSHERIGGETLPLTQEFLSQMLGTRRSTVSVAASLLQKSGMITYTRGNVTILNKSKLEAAACDCYEIIRQQKDRWQSENS